MTPIALKISCRSNRQEVFCKKAVLKNFAKFTWKHLCWSLFFRVLLTLQKQLFPFFLSVMFLLPRFIDKLFVLRITGLFENSFPGGGRVKLFCNFIKKDMDGTGVFQWIWRNQIDWAKNLMTFREKLIQY